MSKNKKVIYFASDVSKSALTQIRLHAPLKYAGFTIEHFDYQDKDSFFQKYEFDSTTYITIQRDFPKKINLYFNILNEARKRNIPLIYEIDDLLFDLPHNHPLMQGSCYSLNFTPMLNAISNSDLVTVSTPPIADYLKPFNSNIKVLPNYLIDEYWFFLPVENNQSISEKIVIGYIGGSTHKDDIESILDPLLEINKQYPGKIRFEFWGANPPVKIKESTSIKVKPIIPDYEKFAKTIQNQKFDILIAPLKNNEFNQAKSNIKFLEYSTLGAPGIFSNLRPFKEIVENGSNGFIAETPEEWAQYLRILIESPEKRREIAINAQITVKNNYMLSKHADAWLQAYQSIEPNIKKNKNKTIKNNVDEKEEILKNIFIIQQNQCRQLAYQVKSDKSKIEIYMIEFIFFVSNSIKKIKSLIAKFLRK